MSKTKNILFPYPYRHCIRAKCIFLNNSKCQFELHPSNNKLYRKLTRSLGHCSYYKSKYEAKFEFEILSKLEILENKYRRKLQKEIYRLEKIPYLEFNHNIASKEFDPKVLTIFFSLSYNLDKNYHRPPFSPVEIAKRFISELNNDFYNLKTLFNDFLTRIFNNRPFKKARKTFRQEYNSFYRRYSQLIRQLKIYRRKLILRNILLTHLFTGLREKMTISFEEIDSKIYFYFQDYCIKSLKYGHSYRFTNTGRRKRRVEWNDFELSPISNKYCNNEYFYFEVKDHPIFRFIRRRKLWLEIQNIFTSEIVKILNSNNYKINTIYFSKENNPDIPNSKSRIDYFI